MLKEMAIILILLMLGWSGFSDEAQAAQKLDASAVFERLKLLEGIWQGEGGTLGSEPNSVIHEFKVAAGGTVVMEIMDPQGEREINVYHVDGSDVVMTHYCGGGSQPRLKLDHARASREAMFFEYIDATNLQNPAEDRHIHASSLVFADADHIESWWTVFKDGRELAKSRFTLERTSRPKVTE